jgi:hypothetical protein
MAPLVAGALVFLYLAWDVDERYAYYIIPFVIGLAVVHMLSPQIDWWWYRRYPPELPARLRQFLVQRYGYYQRLSLADKERFRKRMALYMFAREFLPMGMEHFPVDVQGMIAATAVQLTMAREDYLLSPFERIVLYKHPFPSPQYPDRWHASEVYFPDGVLMFSAEQLVPSFLEPVRYFPLLVYEYARVVRSVDGGRAWPEWTTADWPVLEEVGGYRRTDIEHWIGLPEPDLSAVAVVVYFVRPERFRAAYPAAYEWFAANLSPV